MVTLYPKLHTILLFNKNTDYVETIHKFYVKELQYDDMKKMEYL